MTRRAAAVAALVLVACSANTSRWMPARPGGLPAQSVARALVVEPYSIPAILAAGGIALGDLQLESDTGSAIEIRSGAEGARLGGTHLVLDADGAEARGRSRGEPTDIRSISVFTVYYVPRDRWPMLPPELRP